MAINFSDHISAVIALPPSTPIDSRCQFGPGGNKNLLHVPSALQIMFILEPLSLNLSQQSK